MSTFLSRLKQKAPSKLFALALLAVWSCTTRSLTLLSEPEPDVQLYSSSSSTDIPKDWSILICTLDERTHFFEPLYQKLTAQIAALHLEDRVQIIVCKDNKKYTVGHKRNLLLDASENSAYVNFLDDDDDVHEQYIEMIYTSIKQTPRPDCVSLVGIITWDGSHPELFIHSLSYNTYFQKDGVYYRPPNHLNTMRRDVATLFRFPEISFGEDTDWAMRVARSGLLKTEVVIDTPYYFYLYRTKK